MWQSAVKLDKSMTTIAYRGTGPAMNDLIGGQVQSMFDNAPSAMPHIQGGRLRPLAITSAQRSPLLPEVPTFSEAGLPKIDFSAWFAVFAASGTPAPLLDELARQLMAVTQAPETRAKLLEAGFSVRSTGRADTERLLKSEAQRWAAVVKATGFKAD